MKLSDLPSPPLTVSAVLAAVLTFVNAVMFWWMTDQTQRLRTLENEFAKTKGAMEALQTLLSTTQSTMQAIMHEEGILGANNRHLLTMYYAHEQLLRHGAPVFPAPGDKEPEYPLSKRQGR